MRVIINRLTTVAIAGFVLATTLGVATAAPAGAESGYAPVLEPAAAAPKFADTDTSAASLTTVVAKRQTAVATASSVLAPAAARPAARAGSARGEAATAQMLLRRYIAQYPILKGATVSFGDARGYQAISYYQSGRIVISAKHTASLERIMAHEIWHIIDWRDNGRIDWGENVPPKR